MKKRWLITALVAASAAVCATDAQAITAWARKYGVSCNTCHVAGYKLTGMGQKVLRGGHKMPGAQDKEKNLSDYLALTAKIRTWGSSSKVQETNKEDVTTKKSSFEEHALSIYTGGPLDRGFSYFAEMYLHENEKKFTATASEKNESDQGDWGRSKLAEAYLQYNYALPIEDAEVSARIGRIMPWLVHLHGGGARLEFDRPLAFKENVGNNPYRAFSRQYGVGVAGSWKDAFLELGLVNGTGKHENAVEAETDNHKDLYLALDYTFDGNGSMLGAYYYKGYWPMHWFKTDAGVFHSASADKFHQYGLMGNYTFKVQKVGGSLIGAFLTGNDRYRETGKQDEVNHRHSTWYLETQGHFFEDVLAPYFKYEYFDPDTAKSDNEKYGPVLGINWKPMDHGRFVLEGSKFSKRISQTKKQFDDSLTLEVQFMF